MKIKLWLAYMAICCSMFHSEVSANQVRPEDTTPMRVLLSMDTLFVPSTNSEGFLVIKSSEYEKLKKQIKAQFEFLEAEVNRPNKLGRDSIQQVPTTLEENTGNSSEIDELTTIQNQEGAFDQLYPILIGFFLITCSILIFVYFTNLRKVKESQTRLADLENEFSNYKSTMIDRERKLMRDLINARKPE